METKKENFIQLVFDFFETGAFEFAFFVKLRTDEDFLHEESSYGYGSLLKWADPGGNTDTTHLFLEQTFVQKQNCGSLEICAFMEYLQAVMENLPRDWGGVLTRYYWQKKLPAHTGDRARTRENAIKGLAEAMWQKPYYACDSDSIMRRLINAVTLAKQAVNLENAERSLKFIQSRGPEMIEGVVYEYATKLQGVEDIAEEIPIPVEAESVDDEYFAVKPADTEISGENAYVFFLFADRKYIKESKEPRFLLCKEDYPNWKAVHFKMTRLLGGMPGDIIVPETQEDGNYVKITANCITMLCKYRLYRNGKFIQEDYKPVFSDRLGSTADKYLIKVVRDDAAVDLDLICEKLAGFAGHKSKLQKKTSDESTSEPLGKACYVIHTMNVLKKHCDSYEGMPETARVDGLHGKMLKFRNSGNPIRREEILWLLSASMIDFDRVPADF